MTSFRIPDAMRLLSALLLSLAVLTTAPVQATERRKVIIDQDTFEGPNLQPILMLMQDPTVEVLGITIVSGDGWAAEGRSPHSSHLGVPALSQFGYAGS